MRVNVANRHKNSHRADEARRFPRHLAWLRKRPCLLADKPGHVCSGKMEAHHVNEGSGRGMGQKAGDEWCVPLCGAAHQAVHSAGVKTWQLRHGVNLLEAAKAYAALSPHKRLWEHPR